MRCRQILIIKNFLLSLANFNLKINMLDNLFSVFQGNNQFYIIILRAN